MKNLPKCTGLLFTALAALAYTLPAVAADEKIPVLIPESSVHTPADAGVNGHTHLRILLVPNATAPTPLQMAQWNTPATIRATYSLPSTGGSNAIALVDAYDYPHALTDFNTFSTMYSLPTEPSTNPTTTNSVFQVVYASGTKPPSGGNTIGSWNIEAALDTQWAHSMAPNAKIYLVEAKSPSTTDLYNAVKLAATLVGVKEVSMSFGSSEYAGEASANSYFQASGVVFVASSGDDNTVEYPSASQFVVSAGGTSISRDINGNFLSETGWSDTGCGDSRVIQRPTFQNHIATIVGTHRGTADFSFDADPNTGVYVYNTSPYEGTNGGYYIVGGTSVAAPSLAGIINLAASTNGFATSSQAEALRIYEGLGNASEFRDITSGTDGSFSCAVGWDFITGVGSCIGLKGK